MPLYRFPLQPAEEMMTKFRAMALSTIAGVGMITAMSVGGAQQPPAAEEAKPEEAAVERTREKVQLLDNIFKQTIVLITDKYVNSEDDFAAGSAAVLLFNTISDSGDDKVRLIDATGDPFDAENVARDDFERQGIKALKSGAKIHEKVVTKDGQSFLRTLTPVPVVMQKCVMCHPHYADAKEGEPIGAISYTVPID